jgi:hypothetical protein
MKTDALLRRLSLPADLPRYYWKAATHYGFHPATGARLLARALRQGYWPAEAFLFGLLNPHQHPDVSECYVSKRNMVRAQRKVNPPGWESMLSDKGIFYRYCETAGIPVPRLFGLYYRGRAGWTAPSRLLTSDEEWVRFFRDECPSPCVIKPSLGRLGMGILPLKREGERFVTPHGERYTPEEIVKRMNAPGEFDSYVIQERLSNHPSLQPVASGEGLTTSRMITFLRADRECDLVNADLKIVIGGNVTSNLNKGLTGNMAGRVSLQDGRLLAVDALVNGQGFVEVERHPDTGALFRDFRIPDWEAAGALAKRAARAFSPVRTVGWDMAFTPAGPVLIEGNFFFDPPNDTFGARELLQRLSTFPGLE